MQRQDSVGSQGSSTSGMSGMSAASSQATTAGDGLGGGPGDMMDQLHTVRTAVSGALLALFKERWEDSKRYACGRLALEHLQLLLLLLQPYFLWTFQYQHWLWNVANYSLLKTLTLPGGYEAYSAVLYIMIVFIWTSLAACGYISWNFVKNGLIPRRWPVKILRLCMMVFYQVFYITVLNYLLAPINCNWLSQSADIKYYNTDFPSHNCMEMPHLSQLAIAAAFSVTYIAVGGLFALADASPNPVSQRFMASAHSSVEVKAWAFKTIIVLCINLLSGFWKLQAVPILIFTTWMAYVYVRWQPYYSPWVNHIRAGLYAMTAWVALMLTANVWAEQDAQEAGLTGDVLSTAVWAAKSAQLSLLATAVMPAALVFGMVVSWLRLHLANRAALPKFRALDISNASAIQGLKDVHKFVDEYEVEIIARCCRSWTDYEDKQLDLDAIKLAELIIKAGLARFPHSAHMVLVYANFLSSVQNSQQSANSQLQAAMKLEPNWCDRYVMFVREQEHMARLQQSTSAGTESAVDLVGYVEFQRNYKQVLRIHKSALYAQRSFWKVLLHSNVTFTALVHALKRIENCRARADRTYKTVLERYPTNVKILRAYARFLEDVRNDPWSASKYYTEADKLEEQEGGEGAEMLALDDGGDGSNKINQVDERNNAVCVINATGTIQMANKMLLKLFGYRKGELEGKNVSMLMPQPFSGRHNTYMRNYQTSGNAKILDTVREVVGLHKDHYVFPITLLVTKVSGTGADAIFMGVIKPVVEDLDSVKAWIMPGGNMLCVDARFTDWFGKSPSDCIGKPFGVLAADADTLNKLLDTATTATEADFKAGKVSAQNVMLTHQYADPQPVDVTIELAGTSDARLFAAVITKRCSADSEHLMVTDHKGRILYITSKLATLLGGTSQSLLKQEISKFMAQPFMQLHSKWMKEMPAKVPSYSCRAGAPVVFISQQRTSIPAKLEISTREQGEENLYIVKVTITDFVNALHSRRLSVKLDSKGTILEASDTPQFVFGFKPAVMVGRNLGHCLDIFTGVPESGDEQGVDMQHLLAVMVAKTLEHKDSSWRCGLHLPLRPEEVAAAKANVIQANMLANQTRAALMTLEVSEQEDEQGHVRVVGITAHLWRAEQLNGVVEVDKDGLIAKAGCCALHQPGPLFGVSSAALLHTPLSHWLNVPGTYEGLLLDSKKKGALKRKAADVKIGPSRHATGRHSDGDPVNIAVQAVVREGAGPERLVVKLSMEKARQGNPSFARRMLGLEETQSRESAMGKATLANGKLGGFSYAVALDAKVQLGQKSLKVHGSVKFGASAAVEDAGDGDGSDDGGGGTEFGARSKRGKGDRITEWVRQASGITATTAAAEEGELDMEESMATTGMMLDGLPPPPPDEATDADGGYVAPPETNLMEQDMGDDQGSGGDAASQASGSEVGAYQSDFKRGKRLRKLARMLSTKQAQKPSNRFYKHTVLVIAGLLCAHLACFIASVVLIDAQRQYIDEVVDAGSAVITMHRMAIDCRVLEALHRGIEREGIFTSSQLQHFEDLFEDAITKFQDDHEKTYLGRNALRRFLNRQKYKLQDYWEKPMWNATELIDTEPPITNIRGMGLWELGNEVIAAAREVQSNHARMVASGKPLSENRFWYFVMENALWALYDGYKLTLYGLVDRVLGKISEVSTAMVILLVLEGCVVFLAASLYVLLLIKQMVSNRANLFSVFLVIPTGFLRALASKQVQLDEDGDSDDDSDAGDVHQEQEQDGQKLVLSTAGIKKGKRSSADGAVDDWFSRNKTKRKTFWTKLSHSLNPLTWFSSQKDKGDSGRKQLVRNSRDAAVITAPFVFWGCIIILVYLITIVQLGNVEAPFRMLNMINFLVFRVTRGVMFALETCMAPTDALKDLRKQQTAVRLHDMEHDYTSFLYGFPALGPGAERDELSVDEPAVFQNEKLAYIFFRETSCLRADQSGCFPPGHKFYDVTHNGLDAMAVRFMQETRLLLADNYSDIGISSPRLEYLWQIGRNDLIDGMTQADMTFRDGVEALFDQLRMAHVIIFVFSLLGALALWLGMVRPYLKQSNKETRQIAEMLSQLPPEMDVEGLIAQALVGDLQEDSTG